MSFNNCYGSFSPIGLTNNPLSTSIFECNASFGSFSPPGPERDITTESGILITTETGVNITTEN